MRRSSRFACCADNNEVPSGRWWISICDMKLPPGNTLVGIAVVQGAKWGQVVDEISKLGIDTASDDIEILGLEFPKTLGDAVPDSYKNRWLTKAEAKELDDLIGDMDS